MPAYDHHLCFVSAQNVAELLGALVPSASCAHLHALASPEMAEKARYLEKSALSKNLRCIIHELPDREPETVKKVLEKIRNNHSAESFAVNISGGTKLMAITAFEWAQNANVDALYVDSAMREIDRYSNGLWQKLDLPNLLDVQALLNL